MNVSIKKAADLMGISQQFLRVLIQHNKLPFAYAVKSKDTNKQWHYYINANGLSQHLGVSVSEVIS